MEDCIEAATNAVRDNAALLPFLIGAAALVAAGIVLAVVSKSRRNAGGALMMLGALALSGAVLLPADSAQAQTTTDCPSGMTPAPKPTGELLSKLGAVTQAYTEYLTPPEKVQMTSDAGWAEDHPLEEALRMCTNTYAPPLPIRVVLSDPKKNVIAYVGQIDVREDPMRLSGVPDGTYTVGLTTAEVKKGDPAPAGLTTAAPLRWTHEFTNCHDMPAQFGPALTRGSVTGGYDGVLHVSSASDTSEITLGPKTPQAELKFSVRPQ